MGVFTNGVGLTSPCWFVSILDVGTGVFRWSVGRSVGSPSSAGGEIVSEACAIPDLLERQKKEKDYIKVKTDDEVFQMDVDDVRAPSVCSSGGGLSKPCAVPQTPPAPHRNSASLLCLCSGSGLLLLRGRNRTHCIRCAEPLALVSTCTCNL